MKVTNFKRIILYSFLFLFVFSVSGCGIDYSGNSKKNSELEQYDTPYTKCEKNRDGTYSFYIYSAPIQYAQGGNYIEKDLSIVDSDKEEYIFMNQASDIKTYFPEKLSDSFSIIQGQKQLDFYFNENVERYLSGEKVEFENMYGDLVDAVKYSYKPDMSVYCYATISGIQVEYICADDMDVPEACIRSDSPLIKKDETGYMILQENESPDFVIYEPIAVTKEGNGKLEFATDLNCTRKPEGYETGIGKNDNIDNVERLSYSIECYVNKMPDSSAYSQKMNNSYLRGYAVIGNHDEFGMGNHYIRLRLNYYISIDADNIIRADYNVKSLGGEYEQDKMKLNQNLTQWSSTQMTWKNQEDYQDIELTSPILEENGWLNFDITEFAKNCIEDATANMESLGCRIKCNEGYAVVATSDNSFYVPYIKIVMKTLPKGFSGETDINNVSVTK